MKALQVSLALTLLATGCYGDPAGPGVLDVLVVGAGADTVWLGAPGEPIPTGVSLLIKDAHGDPAAGASVTWEPVGQNAQILRGSEVGDARGLATAVWQLGTDAAEEQQLRIMVRWGQSRGELTIRARAVPYVVTTLRVTVDSAAVLRLGDSLPVTVTAIDPFGNAFPAPQPSLSLTDTTVAMLAGSHLIAGPKRGATELIVTSDYVTSRVPLHVVQYVASITPAVDTLRFTSLGAELPVAYVMRDDKGALVADTSVAMTTVDTTIVRVADGRLRAFSTGATVLQLAIGAVTANVPVVVDQHVRAISFSADTLIIDALNDTTTLPAVASDSNGFVAPQAQMSFASSNPSVVSVTESGLVSSHRNGSALLVVRSEDGPADTAVITVSQRAASILVSPIADTINKINGEIDVQAIALDRNGVDAPNVGITWSTLDPHLVDLDSLGHVRAKAVGLARLEASADGVTDTALVLVRQVVESIGFAASIDTLSIGDTISLDATATDSNGFAIAIPELEWQTSDPLVAEVVNGVVRALGPGVVSIRAVNDQNAASTDFFVEGVALLVNGSRWLGVGQLSPDDSILITNGRLRLQLTRRFAQQAGIVADVRIAAGWFEATSRPWGDWTYVGTSVFTMPTQVEVLVNTDDELAVKWTYGNHWFLPGTAGFPQNFPDLPYPFEKTVWLRRGAQGYYVLVRPLAQLPPELGSIEHEVGFGGLWGPADIRTSGVAIATDTLSMTVRYDPGTIDASDFRRHNDPVRRVLVSLSGVAMLVPWFWSEEFGGVIVHGLPSAPYSAYLYAASAGDMTSARAVCEQAGREAPFAITFDIDTLTRCGPEP